MRHLITFAVLLAVTLPLFVERLPLKKLGGKLRSTVCRGCR